MRNSSALLGSIAVMFSCHTARMKLVRGGSAAVADTSHLEFQQFFDGRFIPLPTKPFVNCFDAIASKLPIQTCDPTYPGTRYRGYSSSLVPGDPKARRSKTTDSSDTAERTEARDVQLPPWWLRTNRPWDLYFQLQEVVDCYVRGTSRRRGCRPTGYAATTPTPLPSGKARVPGKGNDDPRNPLVPMEVTYETRVPDTVPTETLLWLRTKTVAGRDPKYYVGAFQADRKAMIVPLPEPAKSPEDAARESAFEVEVVGEVPRAVLSFMHMSDAQIREPAAKLGGQVVSDTLDPLIPTFAHDYEQELFSGFFYEAMIRTVNHERDAALEERKRQIVDGAQGEERKEQPVDQSQRDLELEERLALSLAGSYRIPPEFMVHTGDAVDAGLFSEFDEFRSRSDILRIPWFSIVGNHDVLGIGNLALEPANRKDATFERSHQVSGDALACTPITRMLREYFIERPKMNGEHGESEARKRAKAKGSFSLAPIGLREVCVELDVKDPRSVPSDQFLGDRRRGTDPKHWTPTATSRFIEAHCRNRDGWRSADGLWRCARHLRAGTSCGLEGAAPNYPQRASEPGDTKRPQDENTQTPRCSVLNGFDTYDHAREGDPNTGTWPGYYAFQIKTVTLDNKPRPLWMIALNTTSDEGAFGVLCQRDPKDQPPKPQDHDPCPQLDWLKRTLRKINDAQGIAMVFAHHPIWGIDSQKRQQQLKQILFEHGNVIAYIAGHTHWPQLRVVEETCTEKGNQHDPICGDSAKRMWEIIGPSTLEFPQQARQMTLFDVPGTGLAYFEILSFSPHLKGSEKSYVDRANTSAKRDQCKSSPKSCHAGEPRPLEQHLSYSRLWFRVPN